jgi:ferredoxin
MTELPRRRDIRGEGYPPPPLGFHRPPSEGPAVPRLSQATGWQAVATAPSRPPAGPSLRVDWPMCKAHGLCAEVLPEAVRLDEWGYPVVDKGVPLDGETLDAAKRAVQACPTLALRLVQPR